MQTHRIIAAAASIVTLASAKADVAMALSANQRYYQDSALKVRFDSGQLQLQLRDGLVVLDGSCVVDPQLFFFGPSVACPLGATGYIAAGDVDRDGVRDDNQYWSVLSVVPALLIDPSRQDSVQLFSAPPSKLPRPLQNFRDDSVVTFYDISTATVRQYDQSRYDFIRQYGPIRQVETATLLTGIVTTGGTVNVTVTSADIAGSPVVVPIEVIELQAASEWATTIRLALAQNAEITEFYSVGGTGTSITLTELIPNGNDPTLNIAIEEDTAVVPGLPLLTSLNTEGGSLNSTPAAAQRQMAEELVPGTYTFTFPRLTDPSNPLPVDVPVAIPVTVVPYIEPYGAGKSARSGFRFTKGNWDNGYYQMDPRVITTIEWQGNTRAVIRPGDQIYFSILNEAEDFLLFPPTVPQNPVLLTTPTLQRYTMPPFFFEVGDEGVINLEFQRTLGSNAVAFDTSERVFRAKTRMVDTYNGYAQITLPLGSSKRDLKESSNIDGDSMTNIEEFAYQFPTNEDINASAKEQFVPDESPFFDVVQEFNRVITKIDEPITDPELQPVGPAAPFLDADNHIVFEVPYRPRTGNTLRYKFVEYKTTKKGKKKAKKIKNLSKNWDVEFRTEESTLEDVLIEVKLVDALTGDVLEIGPGTPMDVNLTQQFLVLKSKDPVDPAEPLPDLGVLPTAVTVK